MRGSFESKSSAERCRRRGRADSPSPPRCKPRRSRAAPLAQGSATHEDAERQHPDDRPEDHAEHGASRASDVLDQLVPILLGSSRIARRALHDEARLRRSGVASMARSGRSTDQIGLACCARRRPPLPGPRAPPRLRAPPAPLDGVPPDRVFPGDLGTLSAGTRSRMARPGACITIRASTGRAIDARATGGRS